MGRLGRSAGAAPATGQDHAIDCDLNWGHLHVATNQRQRRELAELQQELAEIYGYRSPRLLERAGVESLLATQRYCGGLYDPGSGHLHPLNYTLGLARAAEAAGVRICESSAVTFDPRPAIPCASRRPAALWSARLQPCSPAAALYRGGICAPPRDWRVMPVGTYVVSTEPLGSSASRA